MCNASRKEITRLKNWFFCNYLHILKWIQTGGRERELGIFKKTYIVDSTQCKSFVILDRGQKCTEKNHFLLFFLIIFLIIIGKQQDFFDN
jgi:hypothetical protein